MITYRLATPPPEPPVRLYKIIALSFLGLTLVLLAAVIFMTSKKATITVVAKADERTVSLVAKVGKAEWGKDVLPGEVTSTIIAWTEQFQPTGTKTVPAIAKGSVVLRNTSVTSQPLVATTRLITPQGALFRLAARVVVPAGGQATAPVYADKPGEAHNIGPSQFIIPGLSADRQKQVFAESVAPMQGGLATIGVLREEDVKAAERIYQDKVRAAAVQLFPAAKDSRLETAVTVVSQSVAPDHRLGEEVAGFALTGTSVVAAVRYDAGQLAQLADRAMAQKIDPAFEKVINSDAPPRVSVATYNAATGEAELNVERKVNVTVDANMETLSPEHFVGKKRQEIERYVLGLDHVASVEIKFSPSWIFSAPAAPDRIKVVVKNVE